MLLGSQLRHELGRFPHVTQVAFSSSSLPKPYHLAGGPKYFLLVTTIFSVPSKKTRLFRPPCFVSRVTRLSFDNQPTEHSTLQSSQFLRSISGWCLIQIYSWSSNIFTSVSQLGHRSRRLLRHRLYLSLVPPPCLFLFRPSLFRTNCLSTHVGTLLNVFLVKGGVSSYHSPNMIMIMKGQGFDYKEHCQIPFGAYVQVHVGGLVF